MAIYYNCFRKYRMPGYEKQLNGIFPLKFH